MPNRAIVVDPNVPERFVLRDVDVPAAGKSEAVIAVKAVSLNRGELRRSMSAPAGTRPGWDLAGVVERQAADGSGPKAGTRVVGFLASGAWAEHVAVPTDALAPIADNVSFSDASTLPVAGLTALHALRKGGMLAGRRVLVTGATGGVGLFAIQLARHSGAHVTALVRRADQEKLVRDSGAHNVAVGEDPATLAAAGPFDIVIESVGGATLTAALAALAIDGICILFGTSGGNAVTFDASKFYSGGGKRLYGFILFHELKFETAGAGLAMLADLVSRGELKPMIDAEMPWTKIAEAAKQVMDRKISGKVVLTVG